MKKIVIYLAGSVKKPFLKEKSKLVVDDDIKNQLISKLKKYNTILLDPNESKILSDRLARFGKDVLQVMLSNFVVVDLREKRGIGIGAEMMLAKSHQIPVISVCPKGLHYKKNIIEDGVERSWTHPFVGGLSDVVVDNFEDASEWIADLIKTPKSIKSMKEVKQFSELYIKECLDDDQKFLEKYKQVKGLK
ncbi:hypothetical protein KAJ41_00140 [Candidatus Parcubacteria bacterium]|nr:hypothetical protein [Candidatus Parcubacteria bacterium]